MPEGDTIHYAGNRMRPVLEGFVPDDLRTPHPRFTHDRWPERLKGRAIRSVDAHGKHLFLRFEGDLTIHSHLRMTGSWGVHRPGQRWKRAPRRAWLVMERAGHSVVQFDGPVLELLTESRTRFDQRLAALGPDPIREDYDERVFLRRLREDDPTRPIGDALLDQRTVAGMGTVWRAEACHMVGIDPHRPTGQVGDDDALELVRSVRPAMQECARISPMRRPKAVYGRAGKPCPRCATLVKGGTLWEDNRPVYWCPGCQR
ncbi:DNA-formamidopyrimidine glycosylase family protein [Conexibacter sp. SYSU D00693]|uniref:DNA-formamidopyrimidine glycosylase family protein n=1 Tax=Conexibacter sp. SYSU D00693 TaxID=2812560 RepID=UPI00196A38F8|nr:DNA-formamidopyrimidine glycosylase family protein [Conexibacter sp. SYSU D00693]